uniref:CAP-Gly domain-containing protein n=1 Tax=Parascaris univalens TaxID=6257 RepID=A0A915C866_PARUN
VNCTMNKSTNDQANGGGGVVGKQDVGKRVIVGKVGTGVLRYVGPVQSKEGLFCGVELDLPQGRHNGTYQGITYFQCTDMHGIFAPLYRVELLDEMPRSLKREEKLVRSAMPAIGSLPSYPSVAPSMDVSMASISSVGSSFFDSSIGDRGMRYQLLEEIECPSELIEVDDDPPFSQLNTTSLVLEESRVGIDRLPVVEDDVSTPIVEYRPFDEQQPPLEEGNPFMEELFHADSRPYKEGNDYLLDNDIPTAQPVHPRAQSPSQMSLDSVTSDERNESPTTNAIHARGSPINRSFTITRGAVSKKSPVHAAANKCTISEAAKREAVHRKGEEKEQRPKKPKPPSIRELQNAPTPKPKPKPPSKSQLMMEQIKASIAADKSRPKKEIKSKLSELLAAHPSPSPKTPDENERMTPTDESTKPSVSPNAKRRRNEPLKVMNARTRIAPPPPPATARPPPKPRQSLLPPKNFPSKPKDAELSKKHDMPKGADNSSAVTSQRAIAANASSTKSKLTKKAFPTSAFAEPSNNGPRRTPTKTATTQKPQDLLKLKRLNAAVRGFDALAVVFKYALQKAENEISSLSNGKSDLERRISSLVEKYERAVSVLGSEHSRHLENVARTHQEEINSIQQRYEKQLADTKEEMKQALEEQRCIHEAEMERLSRTHQIQIATLDSKLGEAEKQAVQLVRDKKALEATLSKDANEKVAGLSKEISSLNAALEMKSTEMKELRHINAKLQLKVEEIPPKDIEISKLKHRVRELKQLVDQKMNTEKVLASKYEELQRSARSHAEMSESMLKENDLLRYRIEEMESSTSEGEHSLPKQQVETTPLSARQTSVTLRSRPTQSEGRPSSSVLPSKTSYSSLERMRRSADDDALTRSIVSVYLEQGRSRLSGSNADTIYAPEGTFIARGRGGPRKLSFNDAHDADDEGSARRVLSSEPHGGDYVHAVTDSGISV